MYLESQAVTEGTEALFALLLTVQTVNPGNLAE